MFFYKITGMIVVVLFVLLVRFFLYNQNLQVYDDGQRVRFSAVLSEEPEVKSGSQRFRLQLDGGLQVYVVTRSLPGYHQGDRLLIDGVFTKREYNGHTFWSIYFPKIQIEDKDENIITQLALIIKYKAQTLYYSTLSPVSAGLLLGIVFGGKHSMPEEFLENLRVVGAFHVIAASGMNVAFVAGSLLYMLGSSMKRQYALIFGIVGVIFYTFLTGFEPSIIRAAIMAILAFSASLLGRQHIGIIALLLAATGMLLWQPSFLFDVGFQLSFLATLGILLIKPLFTFKKNVFTEDLGTTLAAQLGTLPILLGVFGNVGILSLLVNSLILWTVPFLMTFGALAVVLGFVYEPLGKLMLYIVVPFLWFFESMVSFFGRFGLLFQINKFSWVLGVGYYLILLAVIIFLQKKKGKTVNEKDDSVKIL